MDEEHINETYELGDTATLECFSPGGPNNTYQWLMDGSVLIGEVSTTLVLPGITVSAGGTYTCVVSNAAGNHSASTLLLISPYFIEQPVEIVLTSAGSTFNVSCVAVAFPDPEYQWGHEDGRDIRTNISTNMSVFTISNVQFGDEGSYYCNVTSNGFVNTSSSALLTGKNNIGRSISRRSRGKTLRLQLENIIIGSTQKIL